MNTSQAKKISLYNLLSHLGYYPRETRKSGNEVWYESPFRPEEKPSFKIKIDQNIWYDFGEGAGGNILDFVMRFNGCNLKGALSFLEAIPLREMKKVFISSPANEQTPDLFDCLPPQILEVKPVYHYVLKEYLKERCIAPGIGFKYLQEIRYKVDKKEYFALGFANRAGGYEIRSPVFKGCIGRKDISIFETGSEKVSVFEGFMDFLSCLTLLQKDNINTDIIVMNSVALKTKAIEFIQTKGYDETLTYFDNDKAGVGVLKTFREKLLGVIVTPCNHLYKNHIDFNDLIRQKLNELRKKR